MQVTVRLFGPLREAAGSKELVVRLPDETSVGSLRAQLARDFPEVAALGSRLRISRNMELADDAERLAEGDEVALLPPVAGGTDDAEVAPPERSAARCTLSAQPLDPAEVSARVADPACGGVVTFVGAVREQARGRRIRQLEYEAYAGMAEREMQKIVDEAEARWPGTRVAAAHRVGLLAVGELAVVIAAAAPHRVEAFEAARFAIDTLKERVPIWKKETAQDGAYWVDDHP